jgi:arylsulfatase A-like enzyme
MTPSRPNPPAKSSRKPNVDPWYDIKRDMLMYVLESRKGYPVKELEQWTTEVRNIDVEYMMRTKNSLKHSPDQPKPFFLYFNYSTTHLPTTPRAEFEDKSGEEEWADELLQMDTDFGTLLDYLTSLDVNDNTIFPTTRGQRN